MCLLFCFVLFWILCCVVCEKIKNKKLLITKKKNYNLVWTDGRTDRQCSCHVFRRKKKWTSLTDIFSEHIIEACDLRIEIL